MNTALRKKRAALRATDLHPHTIRELEHKLDTARDSVSICVEHGDDESVTEWEVCVAALERVLAIPTIKTLSLHPLAQSELDNSVTADMPNDERRMILRDLCRAGWFPEESPTAVCTRKIRTVQVDGKRYEVGSYE